MKYERAYSLLEAKSFDDDERTFSGWATTPTPDRMNDVIDPLGVKFSNPVTLLHQHDHEKPIGLVEFGTPTAKGVPFTASIPEITEPGPLRDRVETAWLEIKYGLVRAVSIGFRPLETPKRNAHGGLDFPETELMELSAVSIPAQAEAVISMVKSFDLAQDLSEQRQAAPGKRRVVTLDKSARDGAKPFVIRDIKRINKG